MNGSKTELAFCVVNSGRVPHSIGRNSTVVCSAFWWIHTRSTAAVRFRLFLSYVPILVGRYRTDRDREKLNRW
jgi:hypothetical protein